MTYDDLEQSAISGEPVELYDFVIGIKHWRYTSGAESISYLGNTYLPEIIGRKDISISDNPFKDDIEVMLNRNNEFAIQFIPYSIDDEVTLTIYRGHDGDYIIYRQGFVRTVTFDENGVPKLRISPKTSAIQRVGSRRTLMRLCDHVLYDGGCKVNQEAYKVIGQISAITGTTIESAAFATKPNGWFTSGKLIINNDVKRFILSHTTNSIVIARPIYNANVGDSFNAYAGCDHLPDTCDSKFSKKLNYGGEEFLPVKNPFTIGPVA